MKKTAFVLVTLVFLLTIIFAIAEVVLVFIKYEPIYKRMQTFSMEPAKWWTSDSVNGPRYIKNKADQEDSMFLKNERWYYNRLKIVNNEGYHDRDDFKELTSGSDSVKILFAGDSFTWGASADVDSSYVEVFENDLKKVHPGVVWNTGIPATGTNHALFTVEKFLPLQKSNYVILGFFTGNDFTDNLLPFDKLVFTTNAACYNEDDIDQEFNPFQMSQQEIFKKATGSYPMEELNFFKKMLIRSRTYSFIADMTDKVKNRITGNKKRNEEKEYELTKAYLQRLKQYTSDHNAKLVVLIIPSWPDIKEKGTHYINAVKLMKELSISCVETIDQYTEQNYIKTGGGHWINSGHIITGHILSKYILDDMNSKVPAVLSNKQPSNK